MTDFAAAPREAGVPITVNSDDPAMFGTTLNSEVALLASDLGLDDESIEAVLRNGFRYAFGEAPQ